MKQDQLEQKVREIFERQGFRIEREGNSFTAENGQILELKAFSSEKYSLEEVVEQVEKSEKVFVDEELEEVEDRVENDVSVIRADGEEPEYETPSYEVIGDIAVINDLAGVSRDEAVHGILQHQNVKTILLKQEGLSGEFRVGEYQKLYGEETETVHKEHGCRYKVDPTQVYFSERFATERQRVVSRIGGGERVLVMFAGVGPFAIMAGRNAEPERVVAVEKNPEAVEYLRQNIKLNSVEDTVEAIEGDVSEVLPELGEKFDRVIMPLPGSADEFLDLAFEFSADNGFIHYYRFMEDGNWEPLLEEVDKASERTGKSYNILEKVICGQRAPDIDRVCIDIEIK